MTTAELLRGIVVAGDTLVRELAGELGIRAEGPRTPRASPGAR